ncbi:unnamed protein product [Candida verbasci]|uniref:Importin N-terminal domain-containing protein n=1 Tax=Candida verbasci TaxID=1227364 RepID=A0A9W4U2L5_9ASCO|nr:unnamed protein product [Candida verbasci]
MDLNYDNLLSTLTLASESNRNINQQNAESQLKKWEIVPGFHYYLQSIYLNQNLPLQIRWLAIILFKNGIDKYWRSTRLHAIPKDEKSQIISNCMSANLINEQNNQLMLQNSYSIAKIARFEFPQDWPNLFDDLLQNLERYVFQDNNLIATNNSLLVLNCIIKTLSTVRIGRARHALQNKAPMIVNILIKLYMKFFNMWINNENLTIMQLCYLCLKNLRRIIPIFDQPHKNKDVEEFLDISIDHLESIILEHEKYSNDLLEKFIKCYSKLYVSIITNNPTSFILIPSSDRIITTFLSILESKADVIYNSTEENNFWEILALKAFAILKKLLSFMFRNGALTLKEKNEKVEVYDALNKLNSEFFKPDTIQHLTDLIINWYLRLKPQDLESWLLEPEEFCNEELQKSWEYQIRPCAENFYQDLIKYFPKELNSFIINKIQNGLMANDSVENILTKDSILCTFQFSSNTLSTQVNYDQLLQNIFIPEGIKNDLVENKILKRRIVLIISDWLNITISKESKVGIYKLFLDFLQSNNPVNDKVVKISTIHSLRSIVDDYDFEKHDFEPFLTEFVNILINFINDLQLIESKLYVLDTLSVMIHNCNPLINYQTLMSILNIIPNNWELSDKEPIIKTSLLRVLRNLIISLNVNSEQTHSIAIPLVDACCSPNSNLYSLVSEDGYDLWLALIQFVPEGNQTNQQLIELFYTLINHALLNSTEILPTILSIIRSYALYSPKLFYQDSIIETFKILSNYLLKIRDDAYLVFIVLMDILLLNSNEQLISNLFNSGLFQNMYAYVIHDNHSFIMIAKMYILFSRLFGNEIFISNFFNLNINYQKFFENWIRCYNHNGNPRNKKINLVGMISLLNYGIINKNELISQLFGEIIKKVFYFIEEVNESDNVMIETYQSNYLYDDIDEYSYMDPENIKPNGEKVRYVKLLNEKDTVYSINLITFLKECLINIRNNIGAIQFNQLVYSLNDKYLNEKLSQIL